MSSLLTKLRTVRWITTVRRRCRSMFSRHLLLTNTAITMGFSATGDLMQQRLETALDKRSEWDSRRTRDVACSGLIIGPLCHFWYQYLDRALPGRALRVVVKKVVADQLIMSPVCVFSFLLVVGYYEGLSRQQLTQELKQKGPSLLAAEMLVWPPLQMFNFLFLPTRYRVLYDNVISLGFDNYYSHVKYRDEIVVVDEQLDEDAIPVTGHVYL